MKVQSEIASVWILLLAMAAAFRCGSQAEDEPRYFSTDSIAILPAGDAALEPVDVPPSLALDVFTEDRRWDAYWRDWKPPSYEVGALASVLFAQSRNKERVAFCVSEWEVCAGYAALPEHALRRSLPRASPIPKDCSDEWQAGAHWQTPDDASRLIALRGRSSAGIASHFTELLLAASRCRWVARPSGRARGNRCCSTLCGDSISRSTRL